MAGLLVIHIFFEVSEGYAGRRAKQVYDRSSVYPLKRK